jgi:hypothetical protein
MPLEAPLDGLPLSVGTCVVSNVKKNVYFTLLNFCTTGPTGFVLTNYKLVLFMTLGKNL